MTIMKIDYITIAHASPPKKKIITPPGPKEN